MSAQFPLAGWTPGASLANYRQIVFGSFVFPLSAQETARSSKLAVNTQAKIPFNRGGSYLAPNTTLAQRDVEITCDVGSGLLGSGGNTLATADDLEAERALLAGLQVQGVQRLWVRPDRYLNAYLSEFGFKYFQDGGGFRFATWTLKFIADDPRYYSASPVTLQFNAGAAIGDTAEHDVALSPLGNERAYPTFTLTGAGFQPEVGVSQNSDATLIAITFGLLTMLTGDTLVVQCDPRPNVRSRVAAIYTPAIGGVAQNGLKFIRVTDFANSYDATEFFPVIYPNVAGQAAFVRMNGGSPNYDATVSYNDTWV